MINKASQGKRGRNGDGGRVEKFFLAACCPPSPSYTNIWIPKRDNEDENDENVKYDNWNEKIIHEIFRLFKLFSSVFRRHSIKYSNALHENSLSPLAMLSCRGWWWLMEEFPGAILGIILDHRWRWSRVNILDEEKTKKIEGLFDILRDEKCKHFQKKL
jgi:hypothetical protein